MMSKETMDRILSRLAGKKKHSKDFIIIHFEDVSPFLKEQDPQRVLLHYLHERGVEAEINRDERGKFIRYYRPDEKVFEDFSTELYEFIIGGGNKK